MKLYTPQPLDTSKVVLPDNIENLIEKLAENIHDTWAQQRIHDGWTYGSQRDDSRLQHPCLLPYQELPDSEKVYDRNTVIATIKSIILLGYTIEPKNRNHSPKIQK